MSPRCAQTGSDRRYRLRAGRNLDRVWPALPPAAGTKSRPCLAGATACGRDQPRPWSTPTARRRVSSRSRQGEAAPGGWARRPVPVQEGRRANRARRAEGRRRAPHFPCGIAKANEFSRHNRGAPTSILHGWGRRYWGRSRVHRGRRRSHPAARTPGLPRRVAVHSHAEFPSSAHRPESTVKRAHPFSRRPWLRGDRNSHEEFPISYGQLWGRGGRGEPTCPPNTAITRPPIPPETPRAPARAWLTWEGRFRGPAPRERVGKPTVIFGASRWRTWA